MSRPFSKTVAEAACAFAFLMLLATSCGPKPGVARAKALLDSGDYAGAVAAADQELANDNRVAALWRIKIRAEMLGGDSAAGVAHYRAWRTILGKPDSVALRDMAELTLWRGLATSSSELNIAAITAVERHKLVRLADEVTDLIAADDDNVAAHAAIAVLRDHPQAASVAAARFSSPDPAARATVIRGIARKIPKRAAKEIRDALLDPAPVVRRAAVGGVAVLSSRDDTAALAKLARFDPDDTVRTRAARALARKPYFPDLELARVLSRDSYVGARLAAIEIAHYKADTGGRDVLREAARSEELPIALRAAVLLGKGPAWEPLFERALTSERWTDRAAALGAVSAAVTREVAIAAAVRAAGDENASVRLAAARLHVRLGDRTSAKPIFERELSSVPPSLPAATALARDWDDRRARAVIATLAGADDRQTRSSVIASIASLGFSADAVLETAVVSALNDKSPLLRMQAADAILTILE